MIYRGPKREPSPSWLDYANDYALAFFGLPWIELDPPKALDAIRYADLHTEGKKRCH